MPEFPEVFTITKNLKDLLTNAQLVEIEILDYHPKISTLEEFQTLINQKVLDVRNISKSIIFEFENGNTIVSHLAMTGRFRYATEKELFGWDKIRFKFLKNNEEFFINFTDTRKFGKLQVSQKIPKEIFPNPLKYSETEIKKIISKILNSNKTIKEILLDQNIFSGLGNIYSNDTLHVSKINPNTKGKELTEEKVIIIIKKAQEILQEGINLGGSSLYDKMYTDIYGQEGKYQESFKIYNLKECKNCGNKITKIKLGGRGTFFCQNCLNIKSPM